MRLISYDAHINIGDCLRASDAGEFVQAAEACGLQAVALVTTASSLEVKPAEQISQLQTLGRSTPLRVVAGIQVEILDISGRISAPTDICEPFPLVLAHLGQRTAGIGRDVPVRWDKLIDNIITCLTSAVNSGLFNVLAYPFNLGRFAGPITPGELPVERVEQLGDAMAAAEVACELCNRAWWWYPELSLNEFTEEFARVLQAFSRCGVKFIAGSDSRSVDGVGNLCYVQRLMQQAGIQRSQLVDLARL